MITPDLSPIVLVLEHNDCVSLADGYPIVDTRAWRRISDLMVAADISCTRMAAHAFGHHQTSELE